MAVIFHLGYLDFIFFASSFVHQPLGGSSQTLVCVFDLGKVLKLMWRLLKCGGLHHPPTQYDLHPQCTAEQQLNGVQ